MAAHHKPLWLYAQQDNYDRDCDADAAGAHRSRHEHQPGVLGMREVPLG